MAESYVTYKTELGECIRQRQAVYGRLNGEKTINAKNDREIEMIKKLLQMMKVGVHKRHKEKEPLVNLLTRLLNRLLRVRADNLARIEPLQNKYNTLKTQCKDASKQAQTNKKALDELKNAIKNQNKLVKDNGLCDSSNHACQARKAKLTKDLATMKKKLAALIKKYNTLMYNKGKCNKALSSKKNKVANVRANNGRLTQDIKKIKKNHKKCTNNVASTNNKHDNCNTKRAACNKNKNNLTGDLETLRSIGAKCSKKLKQCQSARLLHAAQCKKTTAKATGLERDLGNCQNEEEHCQAKLATATALLPKCKADHDKVKAAFDKLEKDHADIAKELETYKPPVTKVTKPLLPVFKPRYPTPSRHKANCYSTGDPHYRNFAGGRFDIYGYYGNFVLVDIPGEFEVETTVRPNPPIWRNRGLNTNVAVRIGSNVMYGRYNRFVLNGKSLNLGVGRTLKLKGGHSIRRTGSTSFIVMHRSGSFVRWSAGNYRGFIYHNIYVYIPVNWVKYANGFCKAQSGSAARSRGFINSVAIRSAADPRHLMGKTIAPTIIPKTSPFHNIPWKSDALRRSAENYCGHKMKLKGSQYVDCLLDAKVVGNVSGATSYNGVAGDLASAEHLKKVENKSAAGHTLREIARMKNLIGASAKRLLVLGNHLKNVHDKTLAEDISRLSTRLSAENTFLNQLQSDFTSEVLKR